MGLCWLPQYICQQPMSLLGYIRQSASFNRAVSSGRSRWRFWLAVTQYVGIGPVGSRCDRTSGALNGRNAW
jgi:hypothetical protein